MAAGRLRYDHHLGDAPGLRPELQAAASSGAAVEPQLGLRFGEAARSARAAGPGPR